MLFSYLKRKVNIINFIYHQISNLDEFINLF